MEILGLVIILGFVISAAILIAKHIHENSVKEQMKRRKQYYKDREQSVAYLTTQLHRYRKRELVISMKDGTVLTELFEPKIQEFHPGYAWSLRIVGGDDFVESRRNHILSSVEFFVDNNGVYRRKDEISTMEIKDVPNE